MKPEQVKAAARGQWLSIILAAGMPADYLDGKNHPCPKCGGDDRFAAFKDVAETGGVNCRKCHSEKNGDGISTVQWLRNCTFEEALEFIAGQLGLQPAKVKPKRPSKTKTPSTSTYPDADTTYKVMRSIYGKGANRTIRYKYGRNGEVFGEYVRFEFENRDKVVRPMSRREDGRWAIKAMEPPRPLYREADLRDATDVLVLEGEKSAEAARQLGFIAVTSPGGCSSAKHADWTPLAGKGAAVFADADEGGEKYRTEVSRLLLHTVSPPAVVKHIDLPSIEPGSRDDIVDFIELRRGEGKSDADIRAEIQALIDATPVVDPEVYKPEPAKQHRQKTDDDGGDKVSTSELLVLSAIMRYDFVRDDRDHVYAVPKSGPNRAIPIQGSATSFRARLSRDYRGDHKKTPPAAALTDALTVLRGEALDKKSVTVNLRVANHEGRIVVDLGDADGHAAIIGADGWEVVDRSPVMFRQTALTGRLPIPERGGSLDALHEFINVSRDDFQLVKGSLIHAFFPDEPHTILLLGGQQGTGKSSAARAYVSLFDPSPAPLRSEPRDLDQWQVAAAGSWAVPLDNISSIRPWFADALCRAATGDGLVKRQLYTDGDLVVLSYRRVIVLTSIDPGALRGDLGERLLLIDLEHIAEGGRRTEQEIDAKYSTVHARTFGALLDAVAAVMAELPNVKPSRLPRMADFARMLMAADRAGVTTNALELYESQQPRIAAEVIEHDAFGSALLEFARKQGKWSGTAGTLLDDMWGDQKKKRPKTWPQPSTATGRLKRLVPAMAAVNVTVTVPTKRTNQGRIITIQAGETHEDSRRETMSSPSHLSPDAPIDKDLRQNGDRGDGDDTNSRQLSSATETNGQPATGDAEEAAVEPYSDSLWLRRLTDDLLGVGATLRLERGRAVARPAVRVPARAAATIRTRQADLVESLRVAFGDKSDDPAEQPIDKT